MQLVIVSEDTKRMDAYSAGVGAFPLLLAAVGERLRIADISAGRGTDRRLSDLGMTIGCEVTVVSSDAAGSMVVAREDMRLALGRGLAHRILVTRVEDDRR